MALMGLHRALARKRNFVKSKIPQILNLTVSNCLYKSFINTTQISSNNFNLLWSFCTGGQKYTLFSKDEELRDILHSIRMVQGVLILSANSGYDFIFGSL